MENSTNEFANIIKLIFIFTTSASEIARIDFIKAEVVDVFTQLACA